MQRYKINWLLESFSVEFSYVERSLHFILLKNMCLSSSPFLRLETNQDVSNAKLLSPDLSAALSILLPAVLVSNAVDWDAANPSLNDGIT